MKRPYQSVRLHMPSISEMAIYGSSCCVAACAKAAWEGERNLTMLLRRADDINIGSALSLMVKGGVHSVDARKLWAVSRSGPSHWCEWLTGVNTLSEMHALLECAPVQPQLVETQ